MLTLPKAPTRTKRTVPPPAYFMNPGTAPASPRPTVRSASTEAPGGSAERSPGPAMRQPEDPPEDAQRSPPPSRSIAIDRVSVPAGAAKSAESPIFSHVGTQDWGSRGRWFESTRPDRAREMNLPGPFGFRGGEAGPLT
jgi:hypothetical protein